MKGEEESLDARVVEKSRYLEAGEHRRPDCQMIAAYAAAIAPFLRLAAGMQAKPRE